MIFTGTNRCRVYAFDRPLTYRIGSLDERFGLSTQEFSDAIHQAASLWEAAIGHTLFNEDPHGEIEIDLVYDKHQAVNDELKKINYTLSDTKTNYGALKAQYDSLETEYEQKSTAYSQDVKIYHDRLDAFKTKMKASCRNGEAPQDVYKLLMVQKIALDNQLNDLQSRKEDLNRTVDLLNSVAASIQEITVNFNLEVADYNDKIKVLGREFNEGCYKSTRYGKSITIYNFNDHDMLVRVLAHEFGHAMGLKHNNNPKAIMYYLNRAKTLELAPEDISALRERYSKN